MLNLSIGATAAALSATCEGTLLFEGNQAVTSLTIDSRKVTKGALFVAIPGERTDGHSFLDAAAANGAAAVLIERTDLPLETLKNRNCSVILCKNTVLALGKIAAAHRESCTARMVAVTGSVGKTTTRQFIHAVLSSALFTHKTGGNLNNELGVPLTLGALTNAHHAAVLELGMSQKGEISYLTHLVRPDIAVITNIGTAHIEFLGSREAIRDAKLEIAEGLPPNGTLIVNGDEPLLHDISGAITVGCEKSADLDYRAVNLRFTPQGMCFDAVCPDTIIKDCRIPTLGEHTVLDAMFAVAVGHIIGLTEDNIRQGLAAFEGVGMRQNLHEEDGCLYILDYYNASVESIRASLSVTKRLAEARNGRTVAILGSVLELGELSEALHRRIGLHIVNYRIDQLYTLGKEAAWIAEEAITYGLLPSCVHSFPNLEDAAALAEAVRTDRRPNDCYLLKASHSVRLERVAEKLLKNLSSSN